MNNKQKKERNIFIILNAIYFVFNYFCIPYLPNPLLFGWLPLQLFAYITSAPVAALLWGTYLRRYYVES